MEEKIKRALPRYFCILPPGTHVGGGGFLLLNGRSLDRYASKWHTREDAVNAAWEEFAKLEAANPLSFLDAEGLFKDGDYSGVSGLDL